MKLVNKKHHYFSILLAILYLFCSSDNQFDNIVTYKVIKKNFENKLNVTGTLEAKKTYTIICPRIWTDLTITYLIPEGTYKRS